MAAAVAAALREARDAIEDYPRVAPDGMEAQHYDEQIEYSQSIILALIPDAGAALDRALAAERQSVVTECVRLVPVVEDQGEWLKNLLDQTRAAIRAQEPNK